jgi:hypothetical protein
MSVLDLFRQEYVNGKVVDKYRLENGNLGLIVEDAATRRRIPPRRQTPTITRTNCIVTHELQSHHYAFFTFSIMGITTRLRSKLTATKGQRNPIWEAMNPPARGPSVMPRDVMEAINPYAFP